MLRFKPAIRQDVRREVGHAKLTSKHNIDDVSPCTRWWSTMLFLGDFAKRLMSGEPRFQPCACRWRRARLQSRARRAAAKVDAQQAQGGHRRLWHRVGSLARDRAGVV